jgi:2-keto-3-deoxy-L-rhamnonate aldolase RhmA
MVFRNRVKEMLKDGEVTVGAWVNFGTPDSSEILAHMGLDWLVFDTEHGPWTIETVQQQIQATARTEVVPIVRVAWNDPVMIKRVLDIGAYGVIVPWVNTKEDAVKAVRAARYPPRGIRGCGPRRAALYGLRRREYLDVADDLVMVIVQVETEEAVNNLEDILSVEGIDAIFVGPADLASSLGLLGQPRHPKTLKTIDRILELGKKFKVPVGIYSLGPDYNKIMIEKGFQFVVLGSDMSFMIHGLREILNKVGKSKA